MEVSPTLSHCISIFHDAQDTFQLLSIKLLTLQKQKLINAIPLCMGRLFEQVLLGGHGLLHSHLKCHGTYRR